MATIPINEPWVDSATLAKHFSFDVSYITRLAKGGKIPFVAMKNGAKTYRRFRISLVEAALMNKTSEPSRDLLP